MIIRTSPAQYFAPNLDALVSMFRPLDIPSPAAPSFPELAAHGDTYEWCHRDFYEQEFSRFGRERINTLFADALIAVHDVDGNPRTDRTEMTDVMAIFSALHMIGGRRGPGFTTEFRFQDGILVFEPTHFVENNPPRAYRFTVPNICGISMLFVQKLDPEGAEPDLAPLQDILERAFIGNPNLFAARKGEDGRLLIGVKPGRMAYLPVAKTWEDMGGRCGDALLNGRVMPAGRG